MVSTSLRLYAISVLSIVTVAQTACGPVSRRADVVLEDNRSVELRVNATESEATSAVVLDVASFQQIAQAFANRRSGVLVSGAGTVIRTLEDDFEPPRHQRFIVKLGNGQTVLVSHNIDLAPRINRLEENTSVAFCGQYEWNDEGGLVHWTHHDPDGRRAGGWIQYAGYVYR